MSFTMAVNKQLSCFNIPWNKTTDHVDDGGGHGLEVHGALALLPHVGIGPHHGLVGVVEAEGHGVASHVEPLQGLHPGVVRVGGDPLHSHLQHGDINTLKPDSFLDTKCRNWKQRYWVSYRENRRCCGEEIQISAVAAQRCQGLGGKTGEHRYVGREGGGQLLLRVPHTSHS